MLKAKDDRAYLNPNRALKPVHLPSNLSSPLESRSNLTDENAVLNHTYDNHIKIEYLEIMKKVKLSVKNI